jgi:hypothetical protein
LALGLAIPSLLPFAIAGIVLGSLPVLAPWISRKAKDLGWWPSPTRQAPRPEYSVRSRRKFPFVAVLVILLLTAIPIALFSARVDLGLPTLSLPGASPPGKAAAPPLEIEVPVTYIGRGTFHDDPERVRMVDMIEVSRAALRRVADEALALRPRHPAAGPLGLSLNPLVRYLGSVTTRQLAAGWRLSRRSTTEDTFVKKQTIPLEADDLPVDTGNKIALPALGRGDPVGGTSVRMHMDAKSQLTLLAPPRTFDSSFPTGSRQTHPVSGIEELTIPLGGRGSVEVDVRSPWFRSEVSSALVSWSLSGLNLLVGVIVTLIVTAASKPIWARIKRLLRLDKLGTKKGDPVRP